MTSEKSWIDTEYAHAYIKDSRNLERIKFITKNFHENITSSIAQACTKLAEVRGTYRMINNEKISPEGILAGHRVATTARVNQERSILIVQDTTVLNYAHHPKTKEIGLCHTHKKSKGLLVHSALAVTPKGVPIGILFQKIWTRNPQKYGSAKLRHSLPIELKESYKWLETAVEASIGLIKEKTKIIHVCDREADIYEFFAKIIQLGHDFVIRLRGNRKLTGDARTLIPALENQPLLGNVKINIPRNSAGKIEERVAEVEIQSLRTSISAPKNMTKKMNPSLEVTGILVRERNAPKHVKQPIYWLLLTTLEVSTLEDALGIIGYYKLRWRIERFHYALKQGCAIEAKEAHSMQALEIIVTISSIVAWFVVYMKYLSESDLILSCEVIFDKKDWQVLYAMVNKKSEIPGTPPTLQEAVVLLARLGGFLNRKCDGVPGIKTIWRGITKFCNAMDAIETLLPNILNNSIDLGHV